MSGYQNSSNALAVLFPAECPLPPARGLREDNSFLCNPRMAVRGLSPK